MNAKLSSSTALGLFFLTLLFAPAALLAQDAKTDVAKPINCSTAEGDIRVLQSEKAHVANQVLNGVTAIAPAGMALGIVTGTEGQKLSVASGDYNEMIDKKIAEIKQQCNME